MLIRRFSTPLELTALDRKPFRKRRGFFIALYFVYYIKIKASSREV